MCFSKHIPFHVALKKEHVGTSMLDGVTEAWQKSICRIDVGEKS